MPVLATVVGALLVVDDDGFFVGVLVTSGDLLTWGDADGDADGEADAELSGRSPRSARPSALRLPSITPLAEVGFASSEPILTVATAPPQLIAVPETSPHFLQMPLTRHSETGGPNGKGRVRAELDVSPDLWFFSCHFKGDPVMPGCLGVDALWQLTGFFLGWLGQLGRGRALGVGEVKFSDQVLPSVKLVEYGVDLKRVFKSKLVLGIADGWLKADGRTIYEAKDLRVGLFQTEPA